MSEFFAMDGYAMFLWPSYLITFVAIIANAVIARRARRLDRESTEVQS